MWAISLGRRRKQQAPGRMNLDQMKAIWFCSRLAIIAFVVHNANTPYSLKDTPSGKVPVFCGTDVKIHDFIDWIAVKRKTAGEFIARNPQVTRQHIRDYLLSVLPDRFLPYGEERDWAPDHEKTI